MDSLCQSMRFRKSCSGGKIFVGHRKSQKSKCFKMQRKASKELLEAFEELLGAFPVVWSTFECFEKHTKFNISAQKHGRKLNVFGATNQNFEIFVKLCGRNLYHIVRETWVGEGSTSPSRGEHRLTVYRAQTSSAHCGRSLQRHVDKRLHKRIMQQ